VLGTTVPVDTVDGPVELKVPSGTQPGTTLLMSKRCAGQAGWRGRAMGRLWRGRGKGQSVKLGDWGSGGDEASQPHPDAARPSHPWFPSATRSGVPKLGAAGTRGNHLVHVRVTIPKSLSGEERKLVEELRVLQQPRATAGVRT
jgi:DnaJ-class molecular chaperone